MDKRLFWIEQRYVVPVLAESVEEAKHIAFQRRTDIARECGPVKDFQHEGSRLRNAGDRDGWDECQPYGGDGRTVGQILDGK